MEPGFTAVLHCQAGVGNATSAIRTISMGWHSPGFCFVLCS